MEVFLTLSLFVLAMLYAHLIPTKPHRHDFNPSHEADIRKIIDAVNRENAKANYLHQLKLMEAKLYCEWEANNKKSAA